MMKKRRRELGNVAALLTASAPTEPGNGDAKQRKRYLVAALCKALSNTNGATPLVNAECADLSPRKKQTLALLLRGDSEKQIAQKLSISIHTVHIHVKSVYKRLNVCSRGELLARFVQTPH